MNKAKTGKRESSIGATYPLKWNKKAIREKAKECNYDIKKIMQEYTGAYEAILSRYRGLLNELFPSRKISTHHTLDEALQVVNKGNFKNRTELRYSCLWAYKILFEHKKLDEIFGKPKEYTKEEAINEANNYKSIAQIRLQNHSLWTYLKNNDLFRIAKPADAMFHRVTTIDEAWELSQYYKNATELRNHAKYAYRILRDNGLLQKRYPDYAKLSEDYWSKEKCFEAAKECTSRTELKRKYPKAYKYAKNNNWIQDYTWFIVTKYVLNRKNNSDLGDEPSSTL